MDLWQYYGHVLALKEKLRKKIIQDAYQRRLVYLIFCIAKSLGLNVTSEEFFSFENEINEAFGVIKKKADILEGEGEYIEINGRKEWVYNYSYIKRIKRLIDSINR